MMTFTPEQQSFIDARILQTKRELLRSWWGMDPIQNRNGDSLPITVDTFSRLRDYCDVTELAGLCDKILCAEAGRLFMMEHSIRETGSDSEAWIDACGRIQSAIHEWLSSRASVDDFARMVRHLEFEQVDCLLDDDRIEEAHGMVDDLEARVGAFHGFTTIYCDFLRRLLPKEATDA